MPKQPCRRCGVNLVARGYCAQCEKASPAAVHERYRGSSASRGYGHRWRVYRRGYLEENPICADPYRRHVGLVVLATDVDHIEAVEGPNDPRFWDRSNHQGLCHACHSYKTVREDGGLQGDMGV